MKRVLLTLILILSGLYAGIAQNISMVEYAIDADPGVGLGTRMNISNGDSIDTEINIPINSLSPGFHNLFLRIQDVDGVWSHTMKRTFFIEQTGSVVEADIAGGEYFFDADPGIGNGTPISYSATDTIISSENVSISGLSPGWHYYGMRLRDTRGTWSIPVFRRLFIDTIQFPGPQSYVADKVEWWIDEIPAQGTGTLVDTEIGDSSEIRLNIPLSAYGPGFHRLYARYHSTSGFWSIPESRTFWIQTLPLAKDTSATMITQAEYFFDADPGFGAGTALQVDDTDTLDRMYIIPLDGFSAGFHTLYVRVKNDFGYWTSLESRQIYIQTIPSPVTSRAPITRAEYFIGDDPGVGKGTPVNIQSDDSVSINQVLDVSAMNLNEYYKISYRFRDSIGNWSVAVTDSFVRLDCDVPGQPLKPYGPATICSGQFYYFNSELPEYGDSLAWDILESELIDNQTISLYSTGDSVRVLANPNYSGTITLVAKAYNDCIYGPWSEALYIEVTGIPGQPVLPEGPSEICSGETRRYTTDTSYGAVTIEWELSPPEAGILTRNGDTAIVEWTDSYNGIASLRYRLIDGCSISEFSPFLNLDVSGPEILAAPEGEGIICDGSERMYILPQLDTSKYNDVTWRSYPSQALTPAPTSLDSMLAGWALTGTEVEVGLYVEAINKCGRSNSSDILWLTVLDDKISMEIDLPANLTACNTAPAGITLPVTNFNEVLTYGGQFFPDSVGSVSFSNGSFQATWNSVTSFPDSVRIEFYAKAVCEDTVRTDTSVWIRFISQAETLELTAPDSLCSSADSFLVSITTAAEVDSFLLDLPFLTGIYTTENYITHPGFTNKTPGDYTLRVYPINVCGAHPTGFSRELHLKQEPPKPYIPSGDQVVCAGEVSVYLNTTGDAGKDYLGYTWKVSPDTAGSFEVHGDSLIINWVESFEGNVDIKINGETDCGLTSSSEIKFVEVHANVIHSLVSGDTLFCPDDTARFNVVHTMPYSQISSWSVDPVFSPITIRNNEEYHFVIPRTELPESVFILPQISSACESPHIQPLKIHLNPFPQVEEITGKDTICVADTSFYGISNMPSYYLYWQVDGNTEFDTSGLGGQLSLFNPQPEEEITINLTYTDRYSGCSRSRQMDAVALPSPIKADIVKKGNRILIYKDIIATKYQWYLNDISVPGATGQFYAPDTLKPGEYFVIAKNPEGCLARSDMFSISNDKKSDIAAPAFKLVPNPAINQFRLIFDDYFEGEIRIQVFDSKSRIWHDEEVELRPSSISNFVELDAGNWDHGIYFIRVIRDGIPFIEKLIIM